MLTKNDFDQIQRIVELVISINVQSQLDEIKERIKFLPTSEQYLAESDRLYGELQSIRQTLEIQSGYKDQIENLNDRVTKLESHICPSSE